MKKNKKLPKIKRPGFLNHPVITHSRFSKANLAIFIVIFAAIGGYILLFSHAAGSTANIFVASNGNNNGINCKRFVVSTSNPDPSGVSLCATWDKAFQLASGGDRIAIESGSYDYNNGQYFTNPNLSNSARVTFFPDLGASITFTSAHKIAASHAIEDGFDYGAGDKFGNSYAFDLAFNPGTQGGLYACVDDVWIQNASVRAASLGAGMSNIHFVNDTIDEGGWQLGQTPDGVTGWNATAIGGALAGQNCPTSSSSMPKASNIEFDHVHFGDSFPQCQNTVLYGSNPQATCREPSHPDCVHFYGPTTGLWIHNSYFDHCGFYMNLNIENTSWVNGDNQLQDALFENNFFGDEIGDDGWIQMIGYPTGSMVCNNVKFRNNTFSHNQIDNTLVVINCPPPNSQTSGGLQFYNNIFEEFAPASNTGACAIGAPNYTQWDHNLFVTGLICGTNTATGDPKFVKPSDDPVSDPAYPWAKEAWSANLHLLAGSAAIGKGLCNSTEAAAADYDGDSRPQDGSACDVGADEYIPAANVFVSTTGNDSTCVRGDPSKPCVTFNKAYQIAQLGDKVEVAAGTYPAQTINWDASKTSVNCDGWVAQQGNVTPVVSGCITFTPAAGAAVSFSGGIGIYGNDVRLLNLNLGTGPSGHNVGVNDGGCGAGSGNKPGYIIIDGIQGHSFGIDYSSHVALLNSTFDPDDTTGPAGQLGACDPDGAGPLSYAQSDHLRISNSLFENVLESAGHHDTCIHATDAGTTPANGALTFLVLDHSRFLNCAEQDMEIQNSGPNPSHDLLIENNYFAAPCSEQPAGTGNNCGPIGTFTLGCSAVQTATPYYNIDFRFNTVDGLLNTDTTAVGCSGLTSYRVYGNIMYAYSGSSANFSCNARVNAGILYRYNVWDGSASGSVNCGDATNLLASGHQTIDPSVANGAVGSTSYNFHLISCTLTAADFISSGSLVSPYGYPSSDYTGATRPKGANYDVGAYESCPAGNTPGDLNSDGKVNLQDLSILLTHYGGQSATASQGDLNGDGRVTLLDLSILLSNYGL